MKDRYRILTLIVILCLGISIVSVYRHRISIHRKDDVIANALVEIQNPVGVRQIHVLNGNEFELSLSDDRKIHALLDIRTTPEAKEKVIFFINNSKQPRAILRQQVNGVWLVTLYVVVQDQEGNDVVVDLAAWLREKKLIYD